MARTEQTVVAWFVVSGAILGAAACEAPPAADEVEMVSSALLGDPLSGLTAAQKARFALAETTFDEVEDLSDGLGPIFNEKSCGNCHNVGGPGGSLGDGIGGMGDAGIREMRTAPLWGLRFVAPTDLLHDGSATSLSDAIMRHDGQALLARNLFALLPQSSKDNLLAFLNTL
jgi:CxxC motif-containing protein (DUF1111 family)